jgi:hypothetical protein
METGSIVEASRTVRDRTGVVVPVYMPPGVDRAVSGALLRDTVESALMHIRLPTHICLSVDGEENGLKFVRALSNELGVKIAWTDRNRGKLMGVRTGIQALFGNRDLEYFAVIDSDGDHLPSELMNFVRAAQLRRAAYAGEEVLVLGRRSCLNRPMGFLRGQAEEFADRILLDVLIYDAAVSGVPLSLEMSTPLEDVPDFHSGYKLFSRDAAKAVFLTEPAYCGAGEDAYYRHACEAVMVVEAIKSGARLIVVNRTTYNEQPVSTFGLLNRARLTADMIVWPCLRLEAPGRFVEQWVRNHAPRLLLTTLAPQGRDDLAETIKLIFDAFGIETVVGDDLFGGPAFI